jgi:hypothetical protein
VAVTIAVVVPNILPDPLTIAPRPTSWLAAGSPNNGYRMSPLPREKAPLGQAHPCRTIVYLYPRPARLSIRLGNYFFFVPPATCFMRALDIGIAYLGPN